MLNNKDNLYKGLTIIIFSFFASWLIITFNYFPHLGFALFLGILTTLVYKHKANKTFFLKVLYAINLFLCFFIFARSSFPLTFLNIIAVISIGSLIVSDSLESLVQISSKPFTIFFDSLLAKNEFYDTKALLSSRALKIGKYQKILNSLVVSGVVLVIVVPLLASSNPIFAKMLTDFFTALRLEEFFEKFFTEWLVLNVLRIPFALCFIFFFSRLLTLVNKSSRSLGTIAIFNHIHFVIPKIVIASVIGLFFVTQAQLYFASAETLARLNISNAQQTVEIFTQLSVVALVVFALMYNDKEKNELSRKLNWVLFIEGIFLISIAFQSDFNYSTIWGFTHKRLWGFVLIAWLLIVFTFFMYKNLRNLSDVVLLKGLILISSGILLAVNIVNFDYLIFRFRKDDYSYIARHTSADSLSHQEQANLIKQELISLGKQGNDPRVWELYSAGNSLLDNIENLQEKYQKDNDDFGIQSLSLYEYLAYLKIKNLDVAEYRLFLEGFTIAEREILLKALPYNAPEHTTGNIELRPLGLTVINITGGENVKNQNYTVYDQNGIALQSGSLDTYSFNHVFGEGKFSVSVFDPLGNITAIQQYVIDSNGVFYPPAN